MQIGNLDQQQAVAFRRQAREPHFVVAYNRRPETLNQSYKREHLSGDRGPTPDSGCQAGEQPTPKGEDVSGQQGGKQQEQHADPGRRHNFQRPGESFEFPGIQDARERVAGPERRRYHDQRAA